ncbi:hypothetical protein BIW11_01196 [Tropilaelaps mercedesae]|uniref:DEP domain-containing protein n=1 Tax=Tropilaelaps mercedesae TaxID=418985 RepID=A0A1V9XHT8_9ACAR|nr:hypothetical protein BIW11_01196 [Tropilaelaps mercedesae]
MPVGRRRKGLKTYDNCFSGGEAVSWTLDYLKRNRELLLSRGQVVTRDKVALLLQKFVEQKIIQDVRGRGVAFKDSSAHLYTFNKENVAPFSGLSSPLRNDPDSSCLRSPVSHTNGGCSGNAHYISSNGTISSFPSSTVAATYFHPIDHAKAIEHHITQLSHQHEYSQPVHKICEPTPSFLPLSTPTPTASCSPKDFVSLSDASSLTRHILWKRLEQLFTSGGQLLLCNAITSGSVTASGRCKTQSDKLKAFSLHVTDYPAAEVCHNVCKVSASGIVLPKTKEDDVPMLVIQAMKCLAKWPQSASGYPTYPGFLSDALKLVQDHFCKQLLLPRTLYELSMVAFTPLMSTLREPEVPISFQYETAFVTANPETKILSRTARKTPLCRFITQIPTMPRPVQQQRERVVQTCVRAASVRRMGSTVSYCMNSAFSVSSSSLSSGISVVSEANAQACKEVENTKEQVIRQLQHLYLIISTKHRRALHLLLRFIYKVGQNGSLIIQKHHANHDVLIDRFSPCLVGALRTNLEQTSMFMRFLVENCDVIFTVPESLRQEIDAAIRHQPQ